MPAEWVFRPFNHDDFDVLHLHDDYYYSCNHKYCCTKCGCVIPPGIVVQINLREGRYYMSSEGIAEIRWDLEFKDYQINGNDVNW